MKEDDKLIARYLTIFFGLFAIGVFISLCVSCAGWKQATKTAMDASFTTIKTGASVAITYYKFKCGSLAKQCAEGKKCKEYQACRAERTEVFAIIVQVYKQIDAAYALYHSYLAQGNEKGAGEVLSKVLRLVEGLTKILVERGIL